MRKITDHRAHFWSRVDSRGPDECWPWTGAASKGYGSMGISGKNHGTHRLAYMYYFGVDPKNFVVMHKCDNPTCCNPRHLCLGTQQDNIKDRVLKKRTAGTFQSGERHAKAKLSWAAVDDIRSGTGCKEYCERYGVSRNTVQMVRRGEIWTDANARKERQFGRQSP